MHQQPAIYRIDRAASRPCAPPNYCKQMSKSRHPSIASAAKRKLIIIPSLPGTQAKTCCICLDTATSWSALPCGHRVCTTCFAQHARVDHRCPYCRADFAPPVAQAQPATSVSASATPTEAAAQAVVPTPDEIQELVAILTACPVPLLPRLLQCVLVEQASRALESR